MTDVNWPAPEPTDDGESQRKLYESKLARLQADEDARLALEKAFVDGVIEVAKGSVDRARASAETVQKSAAAIATIYTAVLGVTFSVTDRPLPSRGMVPALLLGGAIVLSTVYLAYLTRPSDDVDDVERRDDAHSTLAEVVGKYVLWTRTGTMERRHWVRASVLALGFGLLFLPAPFVTFQGAKAGPTAAAPAWPAAPTGVADRGLAAILYKAQVAETAKARATTAIPRKGYDLLWWIAGGLCLAVAVLAPKFLGGDGPTTQSGKIPTFMRF